MGRHMTRGTVVLVDEAESCEAALSTSLDYADRTVVVSRLDLAVPGVAEVVQPGRGGATIDETFRVAADRRMPWVAMRRDIAEPSTALGQMLEATGRRATKDVPGFGALLIGSRPRALERILAVVDLRDGQPSGLMALAAVNVALATGAQLEVLVLGAPGQDPVRCRRFSRPGGGRGRAHRRRGQHGQLERVSPALRGDEGRRRLERRVLPRPGDLAGRGRLTPHADQPGPRRPGLWKERATPLSRRSRPL